MSLLEAYGMNKKICSNCGNDTFRMYSDGKFRLEYCAKCGERR